jgi:LysM repeat protein
MAYLRILAGSTLVLSMSFGASAQVTTVTEAVPAAETEIVRAQYIREGDVSPEEYAALLAEADRVRAYQGHSSSYTGVSYDAATSQSTDNLGYQIDIYDAGTQGAASYAHNGSSYNVVTEAVTSTPLQYPMAKTYPLGTDFSAPEFQAGYSQDYSQATTTYVSAPRVTYEAPVQSFETAQNASHYVVKGDTLYNIAKRNGTSVTAIKQANGLIDNTISLGQTLIVPGGSRVVNVQPHQFTAPVTTVSSVIAQEPVRSGSRPTLVRNVEPIPSSSIYAVLPKDTLYSISRRACVSVADMRSVNANVDPQNLQPGQRLTLPGGHCLR